MTILISALSVAVAAFCVWLTVRIVNQREKWAKWTLAALVGLPVLYLLSFGPACWWFSRPQPKSCRMVSWIAPTWGCAPQAHWPIGWLAVNSRGRVRDAIFWYATRRGRHERIILPYEWDDGGWTFGH